MIFIYPLDGDTSLPVPFVTTPGTITPGKAIIGPCGEGNPFYAFASLPFNIAGGVTANFTGAPVCSADEAANNAAILVMLESPPLDKVSAA